jgi:hypothetical protein
MGERKRVERFADLIGSVERVIQTRATKVKGLPVNREPFDEFFHSVSDRVTGRHEVRRTGTSSCVAPSALLLDARLIPALQPGLLSVGPFRPRCQNR